MWTVTLGQTSGLSSTDVNQTLAVLDEALAFWGRYIDFGSADIEVKIDFIELDDNAIARGGSTFRQNGGSFFQADSIIELQTGVDPNGATEEIFIEVNTLLYNFDAFHFGGLNNPPPADKIDLFTVLLHEIAHGFGFISLFDRPERTVFDSFIVGASGSGFIFDGPITSSDFGLIELTSPDPSHLSDRSSLISETLNFGERRALTALEMWMMRDIGLPFLLPTEGNDTLYGLIGQPSISLLGGDDIYFSEGVGGAVFGGDGRDTITGGGNFHGEGGNDELIGDSTRDTLSGGAGQDLLKGAGDRDSLSGGDDNDTLHGGNDADSMYGDEGDDHLFGDQGRDHLFGDEGDDQLFGGEDGDRLDGGAGADSIWGGSDGDRLIGGTENDELYGDQGNDKLFGGDGDDTLSGGLDVDSLQGGTGADTLDGGDGFDSAEYTASGAPIFLDLTAGVITGGDATGDTLISIERYVATPHNDTLIGAGLNDFFDGFSGNDSLEGRDGADTLQGGDGADTLLGGAGNDSLVAGGDNSRLEGGEGDDYLKTFGVSNIIAHGGEGDDTIEAALGDIDGGAGVDTLLFLISSAEIVQNAAPIAGILSYNHPDLGVLTFKNFEKITSSLFNTPTDIFYGSIGTDVIDVGSGYALVLAGAGNDTITGSAFDEDSGVTIIGAP
ncbi:MAG: calcium-binding protein, partial [Hyphococcus sp.]